MAAKQQLLATIKKLGLYPAIRGVKNFVTAERTFAQCAVLARRNPLAFSQAKTQLELATIAYGPNQWARNRRLALGKLGKADGFKKQKVTCQTQKLYEQANLGISLPAELVGPELKRHIQVLWLNSLLELHGLATLRNDGLSAPLNIDDLPSLAEPAPEFAGGPKISVLVPVYNGAEFLRTALAGLAAQTYRNIEVLVIDDASTDGSREIAKEFAAKDSRFKLIEVKVNGGSYRARNIGLERATGDFVTVHDSDDWSHPQKLERQAKALLEQPRLLATLSQGVRVDNQDFRFLTVANGLFIRKNISSLMFRRVQVLEAIGFWDEVRFGADSEFHERLEAKFGAASVKVIESGPLSFTRFHTTSLTGGGIASTQSGITGVRRFYVDSYNAWHAAIKAGRQQAKLGRGSVGRPFAVPLLQVDRSARYPKFDVVYVADLGVAGASEMLAADSSAKPVALLNLSPAGEKLHPSIRKQIDFEKVVLLLPGDEVTAKLVRITSDADLPKMPEASAKVTAARVEFMDGTEASAAAKKIFGGVS